MRIELKEKVIKWLNGFPLEMECIKLWFREYPQYCLDMLKKEQSEDEFIRELKDDNTDNSNMEKTHSEEPSTPRKNTGALELLNSSEEESEKDIIIKQLEYKIEELEKYKKVIDCIKGNNGSKCMASDFLPIDFIPQDVISKLSSFSKKINEKLPIRIEVPYKRGEPCNNQTLGNQIPNQMKLWLSEELGDSMIFMEMKGSSGYPDARVKIDGIDTELLWEWKTMYGADGTGVRIVISKFPNKRIPLTFKDDSKKYHLWVCLKYDKKVQDNEGKKTSIQITKMDINCILPTTLLNTKFELSTTSKLIKSETSNNNIIRL